MHEERCNWRIQKEDIGALIQIRLQDAGAESTDLEHIKEHTV